jgi:hypothetical protein
MTLGPQVLQRRALGRWRTMCTTFPRDLVEPLAQSWYQSPVRMKLLPSKIFFIVGLHMPPHPVPADILRKFQVQFYYLMLNANIQIGKFIWAVTSCRCHPTTDVFSQHYELHY